MEVLQQQIYAAGGKASYPMIKVIEEEDESLEGTPHLKLAQGFSQQRRSREFQQQINASTQPFQSLITELLKTDTNAQKQDTGGKKYDSQALFEENLWRVNDCQRQTTDTDFRRRIDEIQRKLDEKIVDKMQRSLLRYQETQQLQSSPPRSLSPVPSQHSHNESPVPSRSKEYQIQHESTGNQSAEAALLNGSPLQLSPSSAARRGSQREAVYSPPFHPSEQLFPSPSNRTEDVPEAYQPKSVYSNKVLIAPKHIFISLEGFQKGAAVKSPSKNYFNRSKILTTQQNKENFAVSTITKTETSTTAPNLSGAQAPPATRTVTQVNGSAQKSKSTVPGQSIGGSEGKLSVQGNGKQHRRVPSGDSHQRFIQHALEDYGLSSDDERNIINKGERSVGALSASASTTKTKGQQQQSTPNSKRKSQKTFSWLDFTQQERSDVWMQYRHSKRKDLIYQSIEREKAQCPFQPETATGDALQEPFLATKKRASAPKIQCYNERQQPSNDFHKKVRSVQCYSQLFQLRKEMGFSIQTTANVQKMINGEASQQKHQKCLVADTDQQNVSSNQKIKNKLAVPSEGVSRMTKYFAKNH